MKQQLHFLLFWSRFLYAHSFLKELLIEDWNAISKGIEIGVI